MKKNTNYDILRKWPVSNGKTLVETSEGYSYLNVKGEKEPDVYALATQHNNGFAFVETMNSDVLQKADLLGNISDEDTYFGKRVYEYFCGKISLEDLLADPSLQYDEKLPGFVVMIEEEKIKKSGLSKKQLLKKLSDLHNEIDVIIEDYLRKLDSAFSFGGDIKLER